MKTFYLLLALLFTPIILAITNDASEPIEYIDEVVVADTQTQACVYIYDIIDAYEEEVVVDEKEGLQHKQIEVVATAYCGCVKCCGIWSNEHPDRVGTDFVQQTASGTIPTANRTIATDTSVIPFGAIVSYGGVDYVAEDTGSAIVGNKIDIYFATHEEALEWGRKTITVDVYY